MRLIKIWITREFELWTSLEAPCKALCKQKELDRRDGWVSPHRVAVHDVHYAKKSLRNAHEPFESVCRENIFMKGSWCSGPSNCEVFPNLTSLAWRTWDYVLSNDSPHPFVIASRSARELSWVPWSILDDPVCAVNLAPYSHPVCGSDLLPLLWWHCRKLAIVSPHYQTLCVPILTTPFVQWLLLRLPIRFVSLTCACRLQLWWRCRRLAIASPHFPILMRCRVASLVGSDPLLSSGPELGPCKKTYSPWSMWQ